MYLTIVLLSFLSGLTTIIGVMLALQFKKSVTGIVIGIGFSAGIMLQISFFELISESLSVGGVVKTVIAVCLGILLVATFNFVIPHTHLTSNQEKIDDRSLKTSYLIAFGLILHDFPEGAAMANSFIHSPALGLVIALAIAIHNIPEEFAMAIPLVAVKKRTFLIKTACLSGLAEPAGAIIGLATGNFLPALNPYLMSFAAGAMIFVSIHELLPMARRYQRLSWFLFGMIVSVFAYSMLTVLIPD